MAILPGGVERSRYKETKTKTTHVFKICAPQLNFLSLRGLGFALIWHAWVKEQLSLPSAVCCSSFSFWQAAALHEEARGDPAREAARGGRMATQVVRALWLPEHRSPDHCLLAWPCSL